MQRDSGKHVLGAWKILRVREPPVPHRLRSGQTFVWVISKELAQEVVRLFGAQSALAPLRKTRRDAGLVSVLQRMYGLNACSLV